MGRGLGRAFTIVELLVVIVVVAIVVAVLMPALSDAKAKARRITCNGLLKNVGLANRIFATDNGDLFPWERALADETNRINFPELSGLAPGEQVVRVYLTLSNELSTPRIIVCPADVRERVEDWPKLTTNSVSYFVGLSARETLPQSFMAGDRNLVLDGQELSGRVELKSGAPLQWGKDIHRLQGEIALGDGSVRGLSSGKRLSFGSLKEALENTGVETNVLVVP
jgi:prepilin-type N-terminal cleavage/methylation domain-containing protein